MFEFFIVGNTGGFDRVALKIFLERKIPPVALLSHHKNLDEKSEEQQQQYPFQ